MKDHFHSGYGDGATKDAATTRGHQVVGRVHGVRVRNRVGALFGGEEQVDQVHESGQGLERQRRRAALPRVAGFEARL